jgi:hypothetical protein
MSVADAGKMRGLMGKRKLTTMHLTKQLSTGQSSKEIATPRQVGARNDRRAWWWIHQAATKMWGRDLQELVSSLVLAVAGEASPALSYCLVYHGDEQDNYPCPRNTLHRESDGRSWAMNNTSNLPGVE